MARGAKCGGLAANKSAGAADDSLARSDANPNDLAGTALSDEALFRALSQHRAAMVVLFIDSCRAGSTPTQRRLMEELQANGSVVVYSATKANRPSQESPRWRNGAFTKALVEGLRGRADMYGDGRITASGLESFLAARVKQLTSGEQEPMTVKATTESNRNLYLARIQEYLVMLRSHLGVAPEDEVRVVSPDVGGGFGYKGILLPEEVALGFATRKFGRPLRWLEDRRENLTANANCREHHYLLTAYADADGRLLALDCEATVDSGAYSAYPFSACLEAGQVGSILPGLYDFPHYRCRVYSVATNKPPILPYRGVARTGVCFALEVTLDALARKIGVEPNDLRFKSLVQPHQMPFDNIAKRHFDSGDYPKALRMAIEAIGHDRIRARQKQGEADGRRIGVGYAMYCEQAGHGTSVYAAWGIPFVPGYEQAQARLTPDGGLELRIGAHSHGQGLETTLSQVAHSVLGIPHERIKLIHGDTGETPYSTGTWGSRSMIMSGGAVAAACDALAERVLKIGAGLLQARREDVRLESGMVVSASGRVSVTDVARTWYRRPQDLPGDADPGGLELTMGYKAIRDTGTFSYATHAAVVAVDTFTGELEILDYVVVEDGGVLVNPMIVDGQIYGGCAQGIGTALYEEMAFDAQGQPQASTLSDYMLPGPAEVPEVRVFHLETPSPYTRYGQKGVGEGGAIAPPAAITNAVNDALKGLGAELLVSPITPRRIVEAIDAAGKGTRS